MKKIIIAAYILLCVCLTGCGGTNQKDYGENYNQEQDAQNFSMIRNAAATENGFYVLQDQYVYFIDKKSKKGKSGNSDFPFFVTIPMTFRNGQENFCTVYSA